MNSQCQDSKKSTKYLQNIHKLNSNSKSTFGNCITLNAVMMGVVMGATNPKSTSDLRSYFGNKFEKKIVINL